ncbi:MAG: hypothetical protein KJ709_04885 [Nanoarchaeota archaeon]|nr:hypothetical protein [Nanoarchaeota archaeon]
MREAHDREELLIEVRDIRRKGLFSGFPHADLKRGWYKDSSKKDNGYAWTCHHDTVHLNDEDIHVKSFKILGYGLITLTRPIAEFFFNESFVSFEGPQDSIDRENQVYVEHAGDFHTLESRQDYVRDNGQPVVKGVLLTKHLEDTQDTLDLILGCVERGDRTGAIDYVTMACDLLRKMHASDVVWGNAWLGNTFMHDGEMYGYDFGSKPNPNKSQAWLKGKDLLTLCLSGISHTGEAPSEVVPAVLDAYQPQPDVRRELRHDLQQDCYRSGAALFWHEMLRPYELVFNAIAYEGLWTPKVTRTRKELLKRL